MVKDKVAERMAEDVVALMRDKKNNCAEAMIKVMAERFGFDPALGRMGTAFGGGISGNADLCGFLTGGLIVIGLKFGRTEPGDQEMKNKCYVIGSRYYNWFLKKFGRCTDLKGNPKVAPFDDCYAAARETVPYLLALIEKNESK